MAANKRNAVSQNGLPPPAGVVRSAAKLLARLGIGADEIMPLIAGVAADLADALPAGRAAVTARLWLYQVQAHAATADARRKETADA